MATPGNGQVSKVHIHRRKSSKEEEDNVLIFPLDEPSAPPLQPPPAHQKGRREDGNENGRGGLAHGNGSVKFVSLDSGTPSNGHGEWKGLGHSRVTSNPAIPSSNPAYGQIPVSHSHPPHSPSAGPYRTSFSVTRPVSNMGTYSHLHGTNGHLHPSPAMRQSFSLPAHGAHSRTRSVSGPFSPISPSPLSTSFPASHSSPAATSHGLSIATSSSDLEQPHSPPKGHAFPNGKGLPSSPPGSSQAHTRRHSRLHSRNLSVFFPRPGSLPSTSIAEDGNQEAQFTPSPSYSSSTSDDGIPMPSASPGPGQRTFREGFTFGARPPEEHFDTNSATGSPMSGAARRGHHHKHSLSHNFFSFLEPGGGSEDLHTQPTLTPVSPWAPISPFPMGKSDSKHTGLQTPIEDTNGYAHSFMAREKSPDRKIYTPPQIEPSAAVAAGMQFILGASLWVIGQQVGSLSCTGLGYWVVFDAFGMGLGRVLPGYLAKQSQPGTTRRPYGNSRMETLFMYGQSVYLLFASVYVCKETVEHLLLSSGEGHHHHHGDEVADLFGIEFPSFLLCTTLLSLIGTAVIFNNQAKLVSATGNFIPPLPSLSPVRLSYSTVHYTYPPLVANLLSNPYTLAPVLFCASILCASAVLPPYQHRSFDLLLAGIETVVTFGLAYPAAVAIGAVLLQTAPPRGLPGGRMEAFLRVMREIERHPQVLHLPAPHIWQLAPYFARPQHVRNLAKWDGPAQSLVVTLELHVAKDLPDDDVLRLTTWAWERCKTALRFGSRDGGGEGEADITVGIVRG